MIKSLNQTIADGARTRTDMSLTINRLNEQLAQLQARIAQAERATVAERTEECTTTEEVSGL